jgi:outer membrane immunogenic protein
LKKIFLATVAFLSLNAWASAADLPPQQPYARAPVAVAPAYDWTGFYVGVMGGYGWANDATVGNVAVTDANLKGGFAGGTVGANWQMGQFVIGAESDAAWSNINRTETVGIVTLKDQVQAFGSVTARAGFAANNVLIYGKGGYGWMNNQISASVAGLTFSESHFHNGWTAGGGAEFAFAGPWSAKVEYMFAQYFKETYLAALGGVSLAADVHTVKAGVNYRFGWAPAAVTARY